MNGIISQTENEVVSRLKREDKLQRFKLEEFKGLTRNGGVAVICLDGDIDAFNHHTAITHRPHCLRVFGGPLVFARSFPGFREAFAVGLLENLRLGMTIKDTKTLFLYLHAPCGLAITYNYGIEEQLGLTAEIRNFFVGDQFFLPEKIHCLFHVKRINKGGELEQNTYKIVG